MQTEDIREWALNQGWKEKDFHPYFSDFGLSGTLRPDQRPDMLRLFDDIDEGKFDHGSIICYQENRLFRDETQIYYNQLIDKCKQHDIVIVAISPYLMIYDFRDDFLTEMFRWKCKEAADFIKRHVKGWMHPARYRAAWYDGEWAGYGNIPTGFIVDYDEHNPTYKKLVPYEPHAEKKRDLRLLFIELGCDISLLLARLRISPIIFPEFETWVDPKVVNRYQVGKHIGGGYCPKDRSTIIGMLTDVNDIGYRAINGVIRRNSKGEKIIDHDLIIEQELFDLCYYPLAETDLDGNPIKEGRPRRFFHHPYKGNLGLLKFRIRSEQGEEVVTHTGRGVPGYLIRTLDRTSLRRYKTHAVLPCEEVDKIFANRLMQHARTISQSQEDVVEHERQVEQRKGERQSKLAQMEKSVSDIDREQGGLTRNLGKIEAEIAEAESEGDMLKKSMKERRKQLLEGEIETLEVERMRLLKAIEDIEEESEDDLGSLDEELRKLEAGWPDYSFEKRRSLVNFLVKEVIIDAISAHWVRVEVLWLLEEWGREEMYYCREVGSQSNWTEEEMMILHENYSVLPREQLMALLPMRGWDSIIERARSLDLHRNVWEGDVRGQAFRKHTLRKLAYSDIEFMRDKGIPAESKCTNWESLPTMGQSRSGWIQMNYKRICWFARE